MKSKADWEKGPNYVWNHNYNSNRLENILNIYAHVYYLGTPRRVFTETAERLVERDYRPINTLYYRQNIWF